MFLGVDHSIIDAILEWFTYTPYIYIYIYIYIYPRKVIVLAENMHFLQFTNKCTHFDVSR